MRRLAPVADALSRRPARSGATTGHSPTTSPGALTAKRYRLQRPGATDVELTGDQARHLFAAAARRPDADLDGGLEHGFHYWATRAEGPQPVRCHVYPLPVPSQASPAAVRLVVWGACERDTQQAEQQARQVAARMDDRRHAALDRPAPPLPDVRPGGARPGRHPSPGLGCLRDPRLTTAAATGAGTVRPATIPGPACASAWPSLKC